MKKYELTSECIMVFGHTLYRIQSCNEFVTASGITVKKDELGGYIENEQNLSHDGTAWVFGNARVSGDARVMSEKDYIVLKNSWSSGRYFTYTASNGKWSVGCFYGTGEELVAKAFNDSELSGKCYEAAVKFVEELERIKKENA